ncbi:MULTISPECIES: hypothetical protein [Bacillus]|uniref:hypothetical protein n=1 Tax=Bacillus TaxID=1386 RepID=UPI00098B3EF9|nr:MULTISPECIES: hypothetical protein [Bacillus]QHZ46414.1 hypothetical protein M654_008950 [Bacillus sp. NSP9.1]
MNLEHPMITQIRAYGYPREAVVRQPVWKAKAGAVEGGYSMEAIAIPYSNDRFDQWRLGEAGGSISFTKDGTPVFQFETKDQYERYVMLKRESASTAERGGR